MLVHADPSDILMHARRAWHPDPGLENKISRRRRATPRTCVTSALITLCLAFSLLIDQCFLLLDRPTHTRGVSSTRRHVTPLGSPSNWMVAPQSDVFAAANIHPEAVANEMVGAPAVTRMPVVETPCPLVKRHLLYPVAYSGKLQIDAK